MEPFVLKKEAGKPQLFELASWMRDYPGLTAGFTAREGGASHGSFNSLNCGLHVSDIAEHVVENRKRVAEEVGIPLERWTYGEQVHGTDVAVVTKEHAGRGTTSRDTALQDKDAFITREKGIGLAALFADCVPLYFYDPVTSAIGLAHAGWKGTVGQIARKTVEAMAVAFGSRPSDLRASIGPSIGACCYEVDDRVIDRVKEAIEEPVIEPLQPIYTRNGEKYKLSLQESNRQIMIKAGILPSRIEMTQMCTGCRNDLFFSHRKENGTTGRMIAWIGQRLHE